MKNSCPKKMKEWLTRIQIYSFVFILFLFRLGPYSFRMACGSKGRPRPAELGPQPAGGPRVARGPARSVYKSGYQHLTVNQFSVNFIDPNTGAHTNTVQNMRMTNMAKKAK